jgi:octaprenyl-diphosphate synthase
VTLQEICRPILSELTEFENQFKSTLSSDVLLLNEIVDHIISHTGKRLRPILVLLSAKLVGQVTPHAMKSAILIELLHTATLLHDDVVDESELRRGSPTVNAIWKNKVAILSGDYLFAKVLENLVELRENQSFKILSQVSQRMSQGELLQIERNRDYFMDESIYYRLIADKTASLIAASCELGALTSKAPNAAEHAEKLKNFGENLGIAFQIKDDLLDYVGNQHRTGKPVGNDIIENKITLPLLYVLKKMPPEQTRQIIEIFENDQSAENVEKIQQFVRENGGLQYAERQAEKFIQQATKILDDYADSECKKSLQALTRYITNREK